MPDGMLPESYDGKPTLESCSDLFVHEPEEGRGRKGAQIAYAPTRHTRKAFVSLRYDAFPLALD